MKKRRKKTWIHPKILYLSLVILCVLLVVLSFKFSSHFTVVKTSVGTVISPMQKGINTVGNTITDKVKLFTSKKKLLEENARLKEEVDQLGAANKILTGENSELEN